MLMCIGDEQNDSVVPTPKKWNQPPKFGAPTAPWPLGIYGKLWMDPLSGEGKHFLGTLNK